jgi:hypothetical protein
MSIETTGASIRCPFYTHLLAKKSGHPLKPVTSALGSGQKQTLGKVRLMSALPPKADIRSRLYSFAMNGRCRQHAAGQPLPRVNQSRGDLVGGPDLQSLVQ